MIQIQKIIKYLAIVFAISLIVSIFSGIIMVINGVSAIFTDEEISVEELNELNIKNNIENLVVDLKSTNLIIKKDNKFKIETNNEDLNYKQNNNTIYIEDETKWYKNNLKKDLVIYLPNDFEFNNISVEHGAGTIDIEQLNTKKMYLNLGAGKVAINNLVVTTETEIEGGAGEIIINNSDINNLDLDMGVGKLTLNSILAGESEINAGVGEVNLNLIGSEIDYKIHIEKGLGTAKIENIEMKDDTYYGTGLNEIEISGGIGNINITLEK